MKPTTLRFYERAGLLLAQRSPAGYRLYGEDAVERLGFISSGKRLGLRLKEIRVLLQVWQGGLCVDVRRQLRPMLLTRIAGADRRLAELAAFTDRLTEALAEIDGAARVGRCDPGCGFLQHQHDPALVSVELSPRRLVPEPDPVPVVCTLTGGDQRERIGRWQRLLAGALRREIIAGGLRIHLPAELAGPVAELAAAEQGCCAFFDFALRLVVGTLQLEVRAPAEAAPLVAELFGAVG